MTSNSAGTNSPVSLKAIAQIKGQEEFVEFLRTELEWPIPLHIDRLDDVSIPLDMQRDFGFSEAEDRIQVSRLLNLNEEQPWGIFLFEFKTRRPYLSHLRRLLRVLSSRRTLQRGDPIWDRNDLLFICTQDWQEYQFVHFSGEHPESAVISSFGWRGADDRFLHTLCKHNLPRLRMPEPELDGSFLAETWRKKWREAFNIKPVTDEFYGTLKEVFQAVESGISGLQGEPRRAFTELLINRLIFLKFIEKKGWLNNESDYLYRQFQQYGGQCYWKEFLFHLFFEGLNTDPDQRSADARRVLGAVPFLNAELFGLSELWDDSQVDVEGRSLDLLFEKLLNPYNFTVSETSPMEVEVAFNQDLLGYAYEELIADQHGQGAYYTHPTEVNLMCRESLRVFLINRCPQVEKGFIAELVYGELVQSRGSLVISMEHAVQLYAALHDVTVCDPAIGSGTFPVAMMKHLFVSLRSLGYLLKEYAPFRELIDQTALTDWKKGYELKLHIIERSIFGCDIDYFAVQIAKLRFWIELMVECEQAVPLPNFDFKIVVGDALVGLIGIDKKGNPIILERIIGQPTDKNHQGLGKLLIDKFATLKNTYYNITDAQGRIKLKAEILDAKKTLISNLGIPTPVQEEKQHISWHIDFAEIFSRENGGFDILIANPPYIRHENIDKNLKDFLTSVYGISDKVKINKNSDIYVYFYLRGIALLRTNGVMCYICSNSWLDVGYGVHLQEFLLKNTKIIEIFESSQKKSFENADINTTINLFIKNKNGLVDDHILRFVSLRSGMEKISSSEIIGIEQTTAIKVNDIFRIYPCIQAELHQEGIESENEKIEYSGSKWGGRYLRSPDLFFSILKKGENHLKKLSDVLRVETYLNTGGADDFFIVRPIKDGKNELTTKFMTFDGEEMAVENIYVHPFIKSPSELKKLLIEEGDAQWLLITPPINILNSSLVYKYIGWAEKQGFNQRSGCRNRNPWWKLPPQANNPGSILWGRLHHDKHVIGFNPERIPFTNFYSIHAPDTLLTLAILNSTLIAFFKELMGKTNFGGGVLKTDGNDIKQIPIINPKKIAEEDKKNLEKLISQLLNEPISPVFQSIKNPILRELDETILRILGMSSNIVDDLYDETIKAIERRLQKAKGVQEI